MKQYDITGMSCAACSARVEKAVSQVPGVVSCSVSLLTNSMGVEGDAAPAEIIAAVEEAGYGAAEKGAAAGKAAAAGAEEALADRETPALKRRLLWSLGLLLVLMYFSMGHTMWNWPLPPFYEGNEVAVGLTQLLLSGMILVINQKFFISGFRSLWHRAPNMDTLVALGSTAAFGYSTYALFAMTGAQAQGDAHGVMTYSMEFYFESAAMILTLITVGKLLEARSKGKTTDALKSLIQLTPKTATVVRGGAETEVPVEQVRHTVGKLLEARSKGKTTDALKSLIQLTPKTATVVRGGAETEVPVEQVRQGDVFVVRPGEHIPVDGVVLEGAGAVNESALTGESVPVDKAEGDPVSAATLNQSGFLRCQATRVGEDTTLAQIIQMVSDAAATKAPIAKIADKVSGVFVPAVIAVAAITTLVWLLLGQGVGFALARGISVLVISCPCALGLATPVAIMVGSGVGAKNGILFKTASSLEAAGRTDIVALDKTGTITQGDPRVTDLLPVDGVAEEDLLALAAALEHSSEHPLAGAIVEEAGRRDLPRGSVEGFAAVHGRGVRGKIKGETFLGGNRAMLEEAGIDPAALSAAVDTLAAQGKTPMFFANETRKRFLGVIAVADVIKEDGPRAVQELRNMGIRVVMLTGDNERTARAIGAQAGVDEVIAGVLPDGKEQVIRRLKGQGKVTMVGDGINDAPALTRADLGIAIGAGADVAVDAADVVLMHSRLSDVPAAIRLSRAALRNIHQNLFWAFFYNMIGIPLAAGVLIPLGLTLNPMFAAAAMSLSSFCVVSNALRLNWFDLRNAARDKKKKNPYQEEQPMEKTLMIEGMMCGHCEARVKKVLEGLPGVAQAEVSHEAGTAVVQLSGEVSDETLRQAVEAQDYAVTEIH